MTYRNRDKLDKLRNKVKKLRREFYLLNCTTFTYASEIGECFNLVLHFLECEIELLEDQEPEN